MKVKVFVFQPFEAGKSEEIIEKWMSENIPNTSPKDIRTDQSYSFGINNFGRPMMNAMVSIWYIPEEKDHDDEKTND